MNKVCLIGRLTDNAKLIESNVSNMCTFTLAVRESDDKASFISIVAFGGVADSICKYCSKGSLVAIEGSLRQRVYDASDGSKRNVTEVICNSVDFLSKKPEEDKKATEKAPKKAKKN